MGKRFQRRLFFWFWFHFSESPRQLDKNLRRKIIVLNTCKQVNFMTPATLRAKNSCLRSPGSIKVLYWIFSQPY
ncbi:hypothetical protein FC701_16910 [Bacillus mycoides]|uniref:Uncharacterized protein n=1 Tax=Bacillus mycoides TaxID=1405 RepID=A0A4U3A7L1_BACMY|nr:hypothetical protein FC701_16910 [Bacillus mycoides]